MALGSPLKHFSGILQHAVEMCEHAILCTKRLLLYLPSMTLRCAF